MRKPTILRTLIFVLAMLFNFASYAQDGIAYNSKFPENLNENIFLKANNQPINPISLNANEEPSKNGVAAALTNPVIPYAQLPYAGQVTQCPNDGKMLPKLFLCGGNDSRLIDTKITDAQSIIWERFVSGGTCITVSNSDCANETAASTCWNQVGTGKDYLASSAGQFRVKIVDNTGTPYTFYFNVYQNTLIPTATTKSNIIRNTAGTCVVNGKITVGGFGNGYEYSFTTTGASGAWQDSNVFTTATPGTYTAFIRIKGVVGSCEFKVINLEIKNVTFAITTSVVLPKCSSATGSIQVITNDIKLPYTYNLYNSAGTKISNSNSIDDPDFTFSGLNPGTYKVEAVVAGAPLPACQVLDFKNIVITSPPTALSFTATETTKLNACGTGVITVTPKDGVTPYKYFINIDNTGFVEVPTYSITTSKAGTYVIRVVDVNGCAATDRTIVVADPKKPVYTVAKTDGDCISELGKITINVTDTNSYVLSYNLTPVNTATQFVTGTVTGTTTSYVYNNLAAGIYNLKVRYVKNGVTCDDPVQKITIGASNVLTASAGVAELSGCGPAGKEVQGKVRIANAQGGVPPYLYSFDDKKTWITSNEAYVDPRGPSLPYTFYVKDALGCEYKMTGIIMDFRPDPPTISVKDPVFNCDGSATSTVIVTNSGSGNPNFSYDYFMDGVANTNTPSNVFVNVTQGDHTITVNYNVLSVSTYSNLLQEDFGIGGFTTTPGINPAYCFEDETTPHPIGYTCGGFNDYQINDGKYAVASKITTTFGGTWLVAKDHTTPTNANGRFLCVNVGGTAGIGGILYSKPIKDVIANQPVIISLWAENLIKKANPGYDDPKLTIQLVNNLNGVGGSETIVATTPVASPWVVPKSDKWEYKELLLNPGAYTNLSFVIRSYNNAFNGNDVLIDDIWVRQIPKSCNTVVDFPVYVDGSKAFSAGITGYKDVQCSGDNNGEITLSAKNFDPAKGFQYSVDGGAWQTVIPVPAATSGSKTLTGLSGKIYNIKIRYDSSANSCTFPLAQEIKIPKALKVNATVTKLLTCIEGATITAVATDGTPGYQYQLREADGVTAITAFQDSGVFPDIKKTGTYKVVAKDLNSCQTAVLASVEVVDAIHPTATFDPSALCFVNSAEIIIRVANGVGPYTYTTKFNGGPESSPSASFAGPTVTFTAPAEGSYTFVITDVSTGCTSAPITKVINTKLTTVTPVTTPLDCDPAPNNRAVITGTISGGNGPFVVTRTAGDNTGVLVQPITTGNTFTYTTAVAGNYTFQIKDASGCVITSDATIDALVPVTLGSDNVNPKCNGSSDGTIQLKPGGGAGGFTYSKDGITYNNTSFFTGLGAGNYTYYVKDTNRCTKSITVTLVAPDAISGTASITTPYTCDNPATITVGATVTGGNGIYKYTLNRNGVPLVTQDTKVFGNITAAGNYTVTISDSNLCTFTTTPALTIVALNGPKSMTINKSALTCPTNKVDFSITDVKDAAGVILTGPFKYAIIAPAAAIANNTTGIFNNLDPGVKYTFEVRDANNCVYSQTDEIDPLPVFSISSTVVSDVNCLGDSKGEVTFTVSGLGNGVVYSYQIDALAVQTKTSPATGTSFTIAAPNLNAGLHKITVTNTITKCSQSDTETIAAPAAVLALDPTTIKDVTCNAKGSAVINAKGGWGTYSYAVTPTLPAGATTTQSIKTFSNLTAGDYSFTVTDLKGCQISGTFTIKPEVYPTASIDATSAYCAGGAGATLKVIPNTQTNYNYSINAGVTTQNNGTFSGLTPGKYTIRVTDTSTGCYIDLAEQTIASPISASTKLLADLDCDVTPASPDATIEVTISNGYPDFKYRHNTTGAPFTGGYTNVAAGSSVFTYDTSVSGTHYFEITDKNGCTTVVSRVINAKVFPTAVTIPTNPTCYNGTNGAIEVTASLGLAPYTYEVSTTSAATGFSGMGSNKLTGVGAGTYWFRVTDSKKCPVVVSRTLTNPTQLTAHADVTTQITCGALNAAQSATITVTVDLPGTPFTGPNKYLYSYNGVLPAVTSNTYTTTTSGPVSVVVYDGNGCSYTVPVSPVVKTLNPPTNMTFGTPAAITCATGQDKTNLTVKVDNGVAPFKFEITSTDAVVAPPITVATGILTQDYTFNNLAPGTYHFKVTDDNKCTTIGDFTIDKVLPVIVNGSLVSNVICKGSSDGKITFTVSGNAGTFSYELRNAANVLIPIGQSVRTGNVIDYTGLKADTYTITITNPTTQCTAAKAIEVKEPAIAFAFTAPTITPITCSPNNGKVVINTVGGWGNNRYTLTLPDATVVGPQSNATFSNLTQSGTYGISVADLSGNGCTITDTFNVAAPVQPSASIDLTASDLCFDTAGLAKIVVTPTVASPTYMYNINDGTYQATGTFNNLNPGSYIVKVKDMSTGCILTLAAQTIETELKFNAALNVSANCIGQDTEIKGTISGGKAPYTYTVTINGVLDPTVRNSPTTTFIYTDPTATTATGSTTYLFTLSDTSTTKCSLTSTVIVAPKTNPEFTATPNSTILCNGQATGSITVTIDPNKGVSPYVINVIKDNSVLAVPAPNVNYNTQTSGLPAGTYIVRVTDAKGCFTEKTVVITEPAKIDFKLVDVQIKCVGGGSGTTYGSIAVTALTGGSINATPAASGYIYTLTSNTSATQTYIPTGNEDHIFNVLNFGIYELTVSDKNGCSLTKKINMASPPEDLDIKVTPGPASCTTASLIVTATPTIAGGPYHFAKYPIDPANPTNYDYATYSASYQNADAVSPPALPGDPLLLQSTFNSLLPGVTYSFIVYDETTQCYYFKQADAPTKTSSTLTSTVTEANVTCTGAGDGKVSFTFANPQPTTTQVKYEIYNSQSNTLVSPLVAGTVTLPTTSANNVGPLKPGTYYILFTEQDGSGTTVCLNSSKTFTITQSVIPLSLTANSVKNDNCGSAKGIIEAFAKGGTVRDADIANGITALPYLYQIFPDTGTVGVIDGTDHNPNPLVEPGFPATFNVASHTASTFNKDNGDYIVYTRDANGCVQVAFVKVLLDPAPVITAVANSLCATEGSFVIDVNLTTSGIAPHYYSLDGAGFISMPSATFSIPNLSSGNHTVEVKDFNGCGNKVTLPLISEPLTIKASFTTMPVCEDTDGVITAVVTGGFTPNNFEYTLINNTVPANPNVVQLNDPKFVGQAAGNYTVTVKDINTNCSRSATVDLILPTVIDLLATDISTTPVDCSAPQGTSNNGTLTVNLRAVNNNPDYKYILTPVLPAGPSKTQLNNNVFTGLSAGDYTVSVTSARGCEKTVLANVPAPPAVVASADAVPFSCAVDPTVTTVVVKGLGGTGSYTFSKDGINYFTSNSIPPDNQYTFDIGDNLTTQNPTYWVKDANGCIDTSTLTTALEPLPKLTAATAARSAAPGSQIDCVNGKEVIQINVVGGSIPTNLKYEVSIDGNPYTVIAAAATTTSITYDALTAGATYQFKITDNVTGCDILTNLYNVPLFNAIKVTATTIADAQCKFEKNGSIQINVAGYSGPYTYAIYDGAVALGGAGASGSHDTATSNPFTIPFGLGEGTNYTVRIVETAYPSCPATSNVVTIKEPAALLTLDPLNVTPLGCTTDGAVTITTQGGWGNNVYTLTPPTGPAVTNNDGIFGGLRLAGLYGVSVKDGNGCTLTDSFNLVTPTPPTATIATTSDYCYDDTDFATLVVSPTGGAGGYEYSIDNGQNWQLSNTFDKLTPGTYDITVKDAYGCQVVVSSNEIKPQLLASAENNKDIFCSGVVDGTIKISAAGGYGSYTYTVTKDAGVTSAPIAFPAGLDTAYYTVPAAAGSGSYKFVVYDARNCSYTITNAIVMVPPTPVDLLVSDIDITPVDCNAPQGTNNNGTITVNLRAVNNNPDYTYVLTPVLPAGTAITQPNNNVFTGLTPGQYDVTVTSGRGCPATVSVTIADPVVVTASATATAFSCAVDPTKTTAVVTAGGGTGKYSFSIDGTNYFESNSTPADNKYTFELADTSLVQDPTFYVKDANGCLQTTKLATVLNPLPQLISATATRSAVPGSQIDCENGKEEIEIVVVGGSTPSNFKYEVSIDGLGYTLLSASSGTPFTYSAITAGSNYRFKITDNVTGCSILSNVYDVPLFDKAIVNASTASNVDCNGNASGAIEINIADYTGPYDYAVYNGTNPVAVFSGSGNTTANPFVIPFGFTAATNYRVVVKETAYPKCTITSGDVKITEPAVLSLIGFKPSVKNQNCGNLAAVITIDPTTITGGTGGYTYAVVPTTVPPTVPANGDYNGFTSIEIATGKIAPAFDSYDVYVKDALGCSDYVTVHIAQDPLPVIVSAIPAQCPSSTGYDITVTAIGFTANLEYSLDGNSWKLNNNILTVQTPGDHIVYVRDENKCVVSTTVNILTPLQLIYELTDSPVCNGNQGVVTLTASGGTLTPSYEYSKDGINFVPSNIFTGLVPGTYTFTVRDTGTNCTKDVKVVIETPNTAINFTLTPTAAICNGGSTGSITVTLATPTTTVNNNPVYTYAISPSPVGMVLVGNVFTNLPAGLYTVTVTSGKGCPVDDKVTVSEPQPIVVAAPIVSDYGCTEGNKSNYATITVPLPTGGSNEYTVYEFLRNGDPVPVQRGDNPVYTETDLLGGSYVINVYDSKGCVGTSTATINPYIGIDFANPAITVTKPITCINKEDIQVNVTFTGGPAVPLVYTIVATATNPAPYASVSNGSGLFTDLTVGTYTITVKNTVTGCILKTIHYVDEPNTFDILAKNIKNVSCFGTATGSVDLTFVDNKVIPTDDAGSFDYVITGPVNLSGNAPGAVINIPNLLVGVYHVTAKLVGTPTCEVETDFVIEQPVSKLEISEIHTPITCDPGNDGTIDVSANGGWGTYEYELTGPVNVAYSDQSYFENLTDGVYTINVRDLNGCIETLKVTLKIPAPITFTATATVGLLVCNGDTSGEITVSLPKGGQESNYSYILNYLSTNPLMSSAPQSNPVFSGLPAGKYSVTVIDGINCSSPASAEIEINEPSKVESTLVLATGITCKTDATLTLSAVGGTGPYEYSTDQAFTTVAGTFVSSTTFPVGLGDHQYYVRDSKGCVGNISNNVKINALTPLDLKLDLTGALVYCKGDATASIDATAVGGLQNYIYTLLDGNGVVVRPAQPEGYFDLLPKGTYVVKVDSGDCQFDSAPITINEPNEALSVIPTVTDVSCFGSNDGKIVIAATGGTGVIKYAISPNLGQFDDKFVFDRLVPGIYQIIVQDENSCFQIIEREIKEPNVLEGKVFGPILQEICDGDKDGAFTIDITGGRPPYSVSLDNENGTYIPVTGTRHDFTNLKGGTHNVFIKDASCLTKLEVNMDAAVLLNPTFEINYDCVNNAQSNMVTITVDKSNIDLTQIDYSLDGSGTYQPGNIFTNVAPGTHTVTVRHTNGCEVPTASFNIKAYDPLTLALSAGQPEMNVISVTGSGGSPAYEYSFNGEPFTSSNKYKIYKSGDYVVVVRDKNGCTATITVPAVYIDVCLDNYFTPNGDGVYDTWGPGCTNIYNNLEFSIFDRYGRVIAKYHYGQKWDGRYNGAELPSGDYWYVLKLNDEKDAREFVGHFTLYR
ncbi:T9SS type B sorting domain-containing protein [Flavobacterium sp. FlaQc-48]|uniref:T9SS type B sorting domain-containing protein n=1 Tax=Flavobacterium sp. FlaQc-48 TaxID=3374181 RepID=UPI0037565F79